jgi:hypothetical protein
MAHFAKLDENNVVLEVNVIDNKNLLDSNGIEQEEVGVAFLVQWSGGYANWKQTSYNKSFRKNYAGIGYSYNPLRDAFIPPKLYASWKLNETTCLWEPPIAYPNDGKKYAWDEITTSWAEIPE